MKPPCSRPRSCLFCEAPLRDTLALLLLSPFFFGALIVLLLTAAWLLLKEGMRWLKSKRATRRKKQLQKLTLGQTKSAETWTAHKGDLKD